MDSYDSERERERSKILRNPLTATCDGGTFRLASEVEQEKRPREKKENEYEWTK